MSELTFGGRILPQIKADLEHWDVPGDITLKANVSFSSTISVSGGTDDEAKTWELGFTQTILESKLTAVYVDDAKAECYIHSSVITNLPVLDVDNFVKPHDPFRAFYELATNPKSSNSSVFVKMGDWPSWGSPKLTKNGRGRLRHLMGKNRFCTWLIAHRGPKVASDDRMGEIRYLAWVTWQVVFDTTVNLDFMLPEDPGKAQGARLLAHGSGAALSPVKPVLSGFVKEEESWQAVVHGRKSLLATAP
jgi:hypothetical protein